MNSFRRNEMPEIITQTAHADPAGVLNRASGRLREERNGVSQEAPVSPAATAPTTIDALAATKRARKTLQDLMQGVAEQLQQLTAQKRVLAKRQRAEARARTAKVESMIGAACRADKSTHAVVKAALDKQVTDAKLRAFLKAEGWLVASAPARVKGAENE